MRASGFEKNSHDASDAGDVFEDEKSYKLLPRWTTAGRHTDPPGPDDVASLLDLSRYGPLAVRP